MRALDVSRELWRHCGPLGELWEVLEELWEGLGEVLESFGGSGGALGELWEGLGELWDVSERINISKNSRSTAPAAVVLFTGFASAADPWGALGSLWGDF